MKVIMIDDYDEDCQYYFWCQSKMFRLILSCHMIWGGIRKDITLLISSWLPFGQNELCSDGYKMHSNLLQSSEKVRSFFRTIYDIVRFILLACIQNFEFRRRQSDIVLRKRFEKLVNYLLLTACPFIQHLLQIRKNEIKNRYIF